MSSININKFYGTHTCATQTGGRPSGGVSCYFKPTLGPTKTILKEENLLVLTTDTLGVIAL